jgi:PIN domain nuclease of toxin-antitoxin system
LADSIVLDASAIFALLYREPGADKVMDAIQSGIEILVSSVNLCEVATKLASQSHDSAQLSIALAPFLKYVVDFDTRQAIHAGELSRVTRPFGLSLGDRACLALAASRDATAWTTDAVWKKLQIGVPVHLLRG